MFNADWLEEARVVPVLLVERDFGYRGEPLEEPLLNGVCMKTPKKREPTRGLHDALTLPRGCQATHW
jgi:hypothetical protein